MDGIDGLQVQRVVANIQQKNQIAIEKWKWQKKKHSVGIEQWFRPPHKKTPKKLLLLCCSKKLYEFLSSIDTLKVNNVQYCLDPSSLQNIFLSPLQKNERHTVQVLNNMR